MNKKIKKILITPLVLITIMMGACGRNPSGSSTTDSGNDHKIQFWHTFGKLIQDTLQTQIDDFEKLIKDTEGVDVEIVPVYKSDYTTINDAINKGFSTANIPTLAVAYPDHVADYISAESTPGQFVVNMQDYIDDKELGLGKESWEASKEGIEDFNEAWIEEGRAFVRDGLYCFPYLKSSEVMFYNMDMVRRAMAIHDPSVKGDDAIRNYINNLNWDGLMSLSETILNNKEKIGSEIVSPTFYDSDANLFISQMFQSKIPFSSVKDGNGNIDFADGVNRENAEKMVTSLVNYHTKNLVTTKGVYTTYGSDSFKKGECVFSIGSSGGSGYNFSTEFDIGVSKVPSVNNNDKYVSQGVSLTILKSPKYSNSTNEWKTKYAWKFIKYLTGAETNAAMCFGGSEGYVPVRDSAYTTERAISFLSDDSLYAASANVVLSDINGNYFTTPCFKGSAVLRDEVGKLIVSAFKGQSVKTAFDTAIQAALLKFQEDYL